jgi:hypothetical protein
MTHFPSARLFLFRPILFLLAGSDCFNTFFEIIKEPFPMPFPTFPEIPMTTKKTDFPFRSSDVLFGQLSDSTLLNPSPMPEGK